jgi:hypothetical protein
VATAAHATQTIRTACGYAGARGGENSLLSDLSIKCATRTSRKAKQSIRFDGFQN